ncbi:MAG: O-methyltransferase, partial [Planctomycetota bacterium]
AAIAVTSKIAWPEDPPLPANPPLAASEGEKRVLDVITALGSQRGFRNVSAADGRLLRQLTEAAGAQRVVEIGTSNGYSGLWLALALKATGGRLFTHEIDPQRVQMARANFERAGVADIVTVIPGDAHETVKQHTEPIDVLFLDADKRGYIDYLRQLLPLVRPGGLIVAHNMRYPTPDPRYLEAVTADPALDTSFLLMEGAGLGVTLKKR